MSLSVAVGGSVRAPLPAATARRLASAVLRGEGVRHGAVSLAFVGARRMRSLNRAYFGKDRPTDVIAFKFAGAATLGEIYICPEVAQRNARRYRVAPREELLRLVVHGVLHLLGYDHPESAARDASPMWRRQERYLKRLARSR